MPKPPAVLPLAEIVRLCRRGEPGRAEAAIRARLAAHPREPDAWCLFGDLARDRGDRIAAEQLYRKAVALPGAPFEAHVQLGVLLARRGATDEAIAQYAAALALRPTHPLALRNHGALLRTGPRLEEAIDALERAHAQVPDDPETRAHLGAALSARGDSDLAIPHLREAVARAPENLSHHDTLLLVAHYADTLDAAAIADLHRRFGERVERAVSRLPPRTIPIGHGRRLRIGYVSADLRRHSVAFFLEPLLAHHDRARFAVTLYSQTRQLDEVSRRLVSRVDAWRDLTPLGDDEAAALIRADEIDVLVDLSGHTNGNRLGVFARKPAPMQVTWLGYPDTTGLASIDVRLTDADCDPAGLTEALHTEQLLRMEPGFLCYGAPPGAPDVAPTPSTTGRSPTFGSFNALAKVSASTLSLWATLLRETPEARLLLKHGYLSHPQSRARFADRLRAHGLPLERVDLVGFDADLNAHLEAYRQVDVALDTSPYHGTTTTCDALFMGVPVVTLAGATHVARVGVSLLRRAGLDDLVAATAEAYVRIARDLLRDVPRRVAFRAEARARLHAGGLTDAPRMTRALEDALCRAAQTRADVDVADVTRGPSAWQAGPVEVALPDPDAAWRVVGPGLRIAAPADRDDPCASGLALDREASDDALHFLCGVLQEGGRAVDVGAAPGVHALSFARAVGPTGRVLALESRTVPAARLRASAAANRFGHLIVGDAPRPPSPSGAPVAEPRPDVDVAMPRAADVSAPGETLAKFGPGPIAVVRVDTGVVSLEAAFQHLPLPVEGDPLWVVTLAAPGSTDPAAPDPLAPLRARGHDVYRLVPGLGLLQPHPPGTENDAFLHTLFAANAACARALEQRGLLATTAASPLPALPSWETALPRTLLARHPALRAALDLDTPGKSAYREALAHFALASDARQPPAVRAAALRRALERALGAIENLTDLARLLTLARIAWASGQRGLAVETLRTALALASRPGARLDEPFLPPAPRFDAVDTGGRLADWALAAVLEQLERLRAPAVPDPEAPARLALFDQRGFPSPEMARSHALHLQRTV